MFRSLWKEKDFRKTIAAFLVIKVIILSAGILGQAIPLEFTHRQFRSDNIFLNPWTQHDAGAYLDIARNGYNGDFNNGVGNYTWYPFYPLLIKLLSFIGYDLAAFLISNAASFLSIVLLYILVKKELGSRSSYKTTLYMLLFPTAFFFTAMYTESLFLMLSLLCFIFAKRGNYLYAGAAGFFASLARFQGILLFLPLAYIYFSKIGFDIKKANRDFIFLMLIPAGMLVFMMYQGLITGNAMMQFHAQEQQFGRQLVMPFSSLFLEFFKPSTLSSFFINTLNLFIAVVFTALAVLSLRFFSKEYGIYALASIILAVSTTATFGITRFVLVLFPCFMTMEQLSQENKSFKFFLSALYIIFIILLVISTIRFVNEDLYFNAFNWNPK